MAGSIRFPAGCTWERRTAPLPVAGGPELAPGEVLLDGGAVVVGTGNGAVRLSQVQPAGKRMLPAADWARGARPAPGERVGG